jgi:tousled-like kinase
MAILELVDADESLKLRAMLLAKDSAELNAEKRQLERETQNHLSELKLMADLDSLPAELRECPSLPRPGVAVHEPREPSAAPGSRRPGAVERRFLFLELIATGGFGSVFKAYDLQRYTFVACKLHHVSREWGELRREAFVRHVEREIDITVSQQHRRIVETFAVFEMDEHTFVSVMPFCNGGSLQELLNKTGPLPEKDARAIIVQVLHGLLHLHSQRERIIHFDLKPANILFHEGEVRLSDFGLSKVMAAGEGATQHGMELTSYGSGTHGYLPPECYEGDHSRICPKVDIFSAGVVFYMMLFYPNKPFFSRATQQQIMQMNAHAMREETQQLAFPGKVSAEVQAVLRRCLAPRRDERPAVLELLEDAYFVKSK